MSNPIALLVQQLSEPALEQLSVKLILNYRSTCSEAELNSKLWQAATQNKLHPKEIEDAHFAYVAATIDMHARQIVLSTVLDVLGYVPDVPGGGEDGDVYADRHLKSLQ